MKKLLLLTILTIPFFTGCHSSENDTLNEVSQSMQIKSAYYNCLTRLNSNLNSTTRNCTNHFSASQNLTSLLFSLSNDSLNTVISSLTADYNIDDLHKIRESMFESILDIIPANEVLLLSSLHREYISQGGHNIRTLYSLSQKLPQRLKDPFVYSCAASDFIAPKSFWLIEEKAYTRSTLPTIPPSPEEAQEIQCRKNLRDELALCSLDFAYDWIYDALYGPALPEMATLEFIASLVDGGAAVVRYYYCKARPAMN